MARGQIVKVLGDEFHCKRSTIHTSSTELSLCSSDPTFGECSVVLVTSIGCGSSKDATPPSVYEVLKDTLAQKEKAENVLIKYYTNMNWTIIRPGGLVSEPQTGKAILTEDTMAIGSIHREDVANLAVEALSSKNTEKKILSALDPSVVSAANPEGRTSEAFALS